MLIFIIKAHNQAAISKAANNYNAPSKGPKRKEKWVLGSWECIFDGSSLEKTHLIKVLFLYEHPALEFLHF